MIIIHYFSLSENERIWAGAGPYEKVLAAFADEIAFALLYVKGLEFSHISAYNTLKNLRISLQSRLEQQPLGNIQNLGTGRIKKIFTDDIDQIELLLAHAIPEAISELCRNKTLLVIAHRLKTIQDADQILVISDGQIVEKGDHESLCAMNGTYAQMVSL